MSAPSSLDAIAADSEYCGARRVLYSPLQEYIHNLQQQIYFLELEMKYLRDKGGGGTLHVAFETDCKRESIHYQVAMPAAAAAAAAGTAAEEWTASTHLSVPALVWEMG